MVDNDKTAGLIRPGALGAPTSRRALLRAAGLGALAVGVGGILAACGSNDDAAASSGPGGSPGPAASPAATSSSAAGSSAAGSSGSTVSSAAASPAAASGAPGALAKPTPFRIASAPGDNYLIDVVCQDQKIFDKYNLQVGKFIFPQSGVQAMQLFSGGAIDGFQNDTILTMIAAVNSKPGKRPVIVGMRIPDTTYSIVVNKGTWPSPTASFDERMQSLHGKRIGVAAVGAGSDQQLRLALEAAGMKYEDVTHLGVGQFAPGTAQMKANRIDAYVGVTYATSYLMAAAVGGQVLVPFWDDSSPTILSKQQVQPIIVSEDYLKDHLDVVTAWKSAAWDAKDWILANRDAAATLLNQSQFAGTGEAQAKAYIDYYATTVVPGILPDWKVEKDGMDVMIQVAEKLGVVKAGQLTYEGLVADFARA